MKGSVTRRQLIKAGVVTAGLAASAADAMVVASEARSRPGERNQPHVVKISWRLREQQWRRDQSFKEIKSLFEAHRDVVDDIWLFECAGWSFFPTMEHWRGVAKDLGERMGDLRKSGFRVGINAFVTLGHGGESVPNSIPFTLPPMVGHDGAVSDGSPCPVAPEFMKYISGKYSILADLKPDFIYIDDDTRLNGHKNVAWGCFCQTCMTQFSAIVGTRFTRESLVAAFDKPDNRSLREQWVSRNSQVIERFLTQVRLAIHKVDPRIATGLMTIGIEPASYNGANYEKWRAALGARRLRTGHGFYYDAFIGKGPGGGTDRMGLLLKAAEVGRQIASLSPSHDIQYEYETWPDGSLAKSPQTALNEFAVSLVGGGCNGMALSTLGWSAHEEYAPLFQHLSEARPYLDAIHQHSAGNAPHGIWAAWSPNIMARRELLEGEKWLAPPGLDYDADISLFLAARGLPLTMQGGQPAAVLTGRIAEALETDQLRSLLEQGLMMDTASWRILDKRGLSQLTGVRIERSLPLRLASGMTMSVMTDDPLNGSYAGSRHTTGTVRIVDVLAPTAPGVRILEHLDDPAANWGKGSKGLLDAPSITVYENARGGRVAVLSVLPWLLHASAPKYAQLNNIAGWISRERLHVRILNPILLTPFVRLNEQGTKGVILLWNHGLSAIEKVDLMFRGLNADLMEIRMSPGHENGVRSRRISSRTGATITDIAPWSTVAILIG